MKHLFIVNPAAGGSDKSDLVRSKVVSAFAQRPDDEAEIYVTKAPLDATEKIRAEAADGKALRVYACGGDGTFNESWAFRTRRSVPSPPARATISAACSARKRICSAISTR